MNKEKKRKSTLSLKARITIITSIIVIISIASISTIFINKVYDQTANLLKSQALNIAKSAVVSVDGDKFEELAKSMNSSEAYYSELNSKLTQINNDIGVGMLYTLVNQGEENYTYVVDGSGTVEIGYEQQKADFSQEAAMTFEQGKAFTCEPYYIETFDKYYISAFVPIMNSHNQVVGIIEYDYEGSELSEQLREINSLIFIVAAILIVLAVIINRIILTRMFKSMEELVEVMGAVAQGDLSVEIETVRHDEIGQINTALAETVTSIRNIVENIEESSIRVTNTAHNIVDSSKDAAVAYEELANSTTGISEITQKQAAETEKAKVVLEELSLDAQKISAQMNETSLIANQTYESTEEGSKVIDKAQQQMQEIEQSIVNAHTVLDTFVSHMGQIQGIITTISGIAGQTNLLALNASIEAARAGENGKGFAVVADEVGKLAVQSNAATNEIEKIIEYIKGQVTEVLEAIKSSVEMAETGKSYTEHVAHTFEQIRSSSRELERQIDQTKVSIDQITNNVTQINSNMNEMEQVSKVIDSNTMSLAAITEEQMATSEEFNGMAELLNQEAQGLTENISKFKIK